MRRTEGAGPVRWRALEHVWHARVRGTPRARDVSDAAITAVVGLVLLALGLVGLWGGDRTPGTTGGLVHLTTLLLGCTVMLAKRRHPWLTLLAGTLLLAVDLRWSGSVGPVLVFFDLIYSAVLHGGAAAVARLRLAAWVAVVGGFAVAWVLGDDARTAVFLGLQLFAVLMTPLWWGLSVRRQTELAEVHRARADDLRRLAELREAEVLADERARTARDLHDAVAGNLSAIAIHSEAALAAPRDPARDTRALTAIRAASLTSLTEMRSMIGVLRGGTDEVAAPARLARADTLLAVARDSGLDVTWAGARPDALGELPAAVDQAAYRILQEALTNAAKHARGGAVRVHLATAAAPIAHLELLVDSRAPDRAPAPRSPGRGLGLLTMRERAESLGGDLAAGWADDGLWRVRLELPLPVLA
ncbi:two-component sensor histidine kinase [Cellulomonas sp. APG4]|uniref:sensor histidine kinase n=1 Tax=Cellulomonas sp. APG4 TaxID=1538656 RepID=UPI00137A90B7|nr:two-component sensor histidine kinase [Cellulomonas sp. APG4]